MSRLSDGSCETALSPEGSCGVSFGAAGSNAGLSAFGAVPAFLICFNAIKLPAPENMAWNITPSIVISPVCPYSAAAPIATSPDVCASILPPACTKAFGFLKHIAALVSLPPANTVAPSIVAFFNILKTSPSCRPTLELALSVRSTDADSTAVPRAAVPRPPVKQVIATAPATLIAIAVIAPPCC